MPRVLSEAHKKAMQAGRQRAAAKRAEGAAERVAAFEEWSKLDAAAFAARRAGLSGNKPAMLPPEMWPTQADFDIVYGNEDDDGEARI